MNRRALIATLSILGFLPAMVAAEDGRADHGAGQKPAPHYHH
jgi:hypothetical protein